MLLPRTLMSLLWLLPCVASAASTPPDPRTDPAQLLPAQVVWGEPAWNSREPLVEPPLLTRTGAGTLIESAAALRVSAATAEVERPLRAGEPLDLLQASMSRLKVQWHTREDGRLAARLAVRARGAGALRVAVQTRPVMSFTLRAQGSAAPQVLRVASEDLQREAREQVWSPVTEGDLQEIELILDRPTQSAPQILLRQVSVFDQHPARTGDARAVSASLLAKVTDGQPSAAQSSNCSESVSCLPNPPDYFVNASRSVVRLVITRNGVSFNCTGTLINDTNFANQVPYVFTAAHCVDSATTAATVNTIFFYQSATCGGNPTPPVQLAGGAHLLYVNAATDIALLRLNDLAPAGAYFSGWDPTPLANGNSMVMIHHPDGGLKAFSVGTVVPPSLESDFTGDHMLVAWNQGSSTGGSSGAPMHSLQNGQFLVHGLLHGGRALCDFSGQLDSPLNHDFFARLDKDAVGLRSLLQRAAAPVYDYSDVWVPVDELGWGISIYQSEDDRVLLAFYTQDADGFPIWYLSLGGRWTSATRFETDLVLVSNFPALGPVDPSRLSSTSAGSLTINFTTRDLADMTFKLGQGSRSKVMKRFRF